MNQKTKILQSRHANGKLNSFSFYLIILLVFAGFFLASCSSMRSGYGCPTNNPAAKASFRAR